MKIHKIHASLVLGPVASLVLAAGSATAAAPPLPSTHSLSVRAGGALCNVTIENPHFSSGASDRRILFKTRVTCTGTYPVVSVKVTSQLLGGPNIGPKRVVSSADQVQSVQDNGKSVATFYTPEVNAKQVSAPGWYTGSMTARIVAPVPGTIGTRQSKTVYLK